MSNDERMVQWIKIILFVSGSAFLCGMLSKISSKLDVIIYLLK